MTDEELEEIARTIHDFGQKLWSVSRTPFNSAHIEAAIKAVSPIIAETVLARRAARNSSIDQMRALGVGITRLT